MNQDFLYSGRSRTPKMNFWIRFFRWIRASCCLFLFSYLTLPPRFSKNFKNFCKNEGPLITGECLRRCWWRIMETKCVDDNYKMLVTVLVILVTNIHYLFTLASGTNIYKSSPTLSHQHHDVTNMTVTLVNGWPENPRLNLSTPRKSNSSSILL